ncbi:MAG: hypothetical protein ACTHOP_07590 [Mesorhizobium sp.]
MKRLLFSTKALWHAWRASRHMDAAVGAFYQNVYHHEKYLTHNAAMHHFLARAPLPGEESGAGEPRDSEPSPVGGYSTTGQMLLASIVGLFIAGLWIWISARIGR